MGRCGGWRMVITLLFAVLAVLGTSCGGTGGGPSNSGQPLVFQLRGRLNLIAQTTADPRRLLLLATLLDPQGLPFRDRQITFTAEFNDITFIPGNGNQGTALTDNNGQAKITLAAGRLTGMVRIIAEAPPDLNLMAGISVQLTEPGFFNNGPLGILPAAVTFVNPAISTSSPTLTVFEALGGRPPYTWRNSNESLGEITLVGPSGVDSMAEYRLLDPPPAETAAGAALQDTITLVDDELSQATASVEVIFAQCTLETSASSLTFGAAQGGETGQITVKDAIPPLTVTSTFPDAGTVMIDQDTGIVTFTVADIPVGVSPDTLLIRDSRGCMAMVEVNITPAPMPQVTSITLEANPPMVNGAAGGLSLITASVFDENNLPIEGIAVLFTTTLGSLNSPTATTDANGQAFVTLIVPEGTAPGTATVTASARGISASINIDVIDPRDLVRTIKLESSLAFFNGLTGGTSVITATAFDENNLPVNGLEILFMVTPDTVGSLSSLTAITNAAGEATVTLTIPARTAAGMVTVMASAQGIEAMIDIPIVDPNAQVATIVLTATPQVIDGGPGGVSTIRAFVFDANNLPIPGIEVLFSTTEGVLSSLTATSGADGSAMVTLTIPPGTPDGMATVTGSFQGISGTVDVMIGAALVQPVNIVLAASPLTIDGALGGTSAITAFVFDANNLPIEGLTLLFTTTGGAVSPVTATTNAAGQTVVTLTIPAGTPDGTVTVTAMAQGVSGSVDVTLLAGAGGGGPGGGGLVPASIECISASPTTIGVRGSGLAEQSTVTFLVTTVDGIPVPSTTVDFFVTSLGGESVSPTTGLSDMSGEVQTVLTSGTRANDVAITAAVDVDGDMVFDVLTQCTLVTIVGAPPVQGRLSVTRAFANVAGRVTSGLEDAITVFMDDRFGNPVPPNTAVSLTTNAGLVTGQGLANDQGEAAAILQTQAPITPEGLVIVMAHTLGQEPFIDNNGNGIFDAGDTIANDDVPEPFIDRNGNCMFDPGDPNEIFIDVNGNGMWDAAQGTAGTWDEQIFVWDTAPVIFSGGTVADLNCVIQSDGPCPSASSFAVPDGGSATLEILVRDPDGNPITSASSISVSIDGAGDVTPTSFSINDATNCSATACSDDPASFDPASCGGVTNGLTRFTVTVADADAGDTITDPTDETMLIPGPPEAATVTVDITSAIGGTAPGGNGSVTLSISGSVD